MAKEKEEKAVADAPKYGIDDLAELMGIGPASARVWLRNQEVAKIGRSYGWNTKAELDALVNQHKRGKVKDETSAESPKAKKPPKKAA